MVEEWKSDSTGALVEEGVGLRVALEGVRGELRRVERELEGYRLVVGGRVQGVRDGRRGARRGGRRWGGMGGCR